MPELVAGIGSPDVAGLMSSLLGEGAIPQEVYEQALRIRKLLQINYASYFADKQVDAMLFPTSPLPARPIGEDETVLLGSEQVPTFSPLFAILTPGVMPVSRVSAFLQA